MPFFSRGKTHRLGVRVARLPSKHNNSIRIKVRIQPIQGFQALRPKEGSSPGIGELSVPNLIIPQSAFSAVHYSLLFELIRSKKGSCRKTRQLSVPLARLLSNKLTVLHLHQHHHSLFVEIYAILF